MTEKIKDFKVQQRNANKHNPRGMELLSDSIDHDGWIGAITTAADGETFDGSARLETLQYGDVEPIVIEIDGTQPVIIKRTDILTAEDPKAKRLAVRANRIAELNLDWDGEVLFELPAEIDLIELGLWTKDQLSLLLPEVEHREEDEDEVNRLADEAESGEIESRVSLGQVWKLGRHYVACGDSTSEENIRKLIAIASCKTPSFVWSDPPYGVEIVASSGFVGGGEAYDIPFGGVKNRKGYVGGVTATEPQLRSVETKKPKGLEPSAVPSPLARSPFEAPTEPRTL